MFWHSAQGDRPGIRPPSDRAEAGAALKRHAKRACTQSTYCSFVDRDNATRAAALREEAVEAVKHAHIERATARKTIRAEHPRR